MDKIEELYARTYLTESEHDFVEDEIRQYCQENEIKFIYYRKIKTGHIPCFREFKVSGTRGQIMKFVEYLNEKELIDNSWR